MSDIVSGDRRLRLVFLINSMEGGGAERVLANLLGFLHDRLAEYDTELVLLDDLPIIQTIPEGLRVRVLNGRRSLLWSALEFRRYAKMRRADICISLLSRSNVLNVWAARAFGHKAIISERVNTTQHLASSRARAISSFLIRRTYPAAYHVIAVSDGVARDLTENFGVDPARIDVISNPIDERAITLAGQEAPSIDLPPDFAVAVGRLVPNKNFEMMLRAYAAEPRDYDLVILGEGPLRDELTGLVRTLGVENRVIFAGYQRNPYAIVRRARLYVSTSNAEGFPNSLIEAMTLARPVIATDCPSGPFEVLGGHAAQIGQNPFASADHGVLVPVGDVTALIEALRVCDNREILARLSTKAECRAAAYGVDDIIAHYLQIIENATLA